MQSANFMQANMEEITKMLSEGLPQGIYLDSVQYTLQNISSQWGRHRGPGLVAIFRYEHAHQDGFSCEYPINEYQSLEMLIKAIHSDIFFMNINMNYQHLGIGDNDYAKDGMRVHANGKSFILHGINRFYDDENCVMQVDKFVRAVNEELKARYDGKKHSKWSPFHHAFKPFAPWHKGEVEIKALFNVKQPEQVEVARVSL